MELKCKSEYQPLKRLVDDHRSGKQIRVTAGDDPYDLPDLFRRGLLSDDGFIQTSALHSYGYTSRFDADILTPRGHECLRQGGCIKRFLSIPIRATRWALSTLLG